MQRVKAESPVLSSPVEYITDIRHVERQEGEVSHQRVLYYHLQWNISLISDMWKDRKGGCKSSESPVLSSPVEYITDIRHVERQEGEVSHQRVLYCHLQWNISLISDMWKDRKVSHQIP
jgi:hypothetical protein